MTIEPGTSVREIAQRLEEEGVIRHPFLFRAYIAAAGVSSRLRAGDYVFESGLSPKGIVAKLLKGDFKTYRLTIPEGWTVEQIAGYLKTVLFVVGADFAGEFLGLRNDVRDIDVGWDIRDIEGYLFPSTYEVYKLKDPRGLIQLMTGEFRRKFSESIKKGSGKLGLKPDEVMVLASVIEKETSRPEERPLIASVFYNRLKKGMALQSDPTVIYGLKGFDGNLRKQDLANNHRYNTYMHRGLPPGPICNPGGDSINAALNPATTGYLYFVSKNDGTHEFSETFEEHQKAVRKYQVSGLGR